MIGRSRMRHGDDRACDLARVKRTVQIQQSHVWNASLGQMDGSGEFQFFACSDLVDSRA